MESSIFAADHVDSVIAELRSRESGELEDAKFGRLTFFGGSRGLPSYWEGRYLWRYDCTLITLRIGAAPEQQAPSDAQRAYVADMELRYPLFRSGALVLLKPAFRKYIGEQARLKSLIEEFLLTGVTVPSLRSDPTVHEFLYRCTTDPTKAFFVTFENHWATKIRVDETAV